MAPDAPIALDRREAVERFAGFRSGSSDELGGLEGSPLVVVDLDGHPDTPLGALPTLFPSVVVGTTSRTGAIGDLEGVDVALSARGAASAGAGWVEADDLDVAIGRLASGVRASPQASVTLVEVLRAGDPADPGRGLLLESLAYSTLQSGEAFSSWVATRPDRRRGPDHPRVLIVERVADELHLTLNRPEVRNAINAPLRDALCDALRLAAADPSLHGVHLLGAGPDFCSGGDLREFGSRPDGATAHLIRTTRSVAARLIALSERTTAHLHGACVGAGIELSAFAGHLVATPETTVRLPEVGLGLIPGAGGTVSVPRRIGRHRTAWMALTGAPLDAATALAWGLLDEIAPPPERRGST